YILCSIIVCIQLLITHWLDAACVGSSTPLKLQVSKVTVRKSGAFDLTVEKVCLQSIRWKPCHAHSPF
ncbi:MAG: hypothetical protein WCF82_01350, partial [Microcoleus sp.]